MAGIGFELKKILRRDTFLSEAAAYFYGGLISSGPWLMSIICLGILGLYSQAGLNRHQHELFRATVIYSYAFSLIFVGTLQLVTTRYLADRLYAHDNNVIAATFMSSLLLILCIGCPFAAAGYALFIISTLHKILAIGLFLIISLIWLCMIFLSAIKDYNSIVHGFALGTIVSILAAFMLGPHLGTEGYLLGYSSGQLLILCWLMARFLVEFPPRFQIIDHKLLAYFTKYWELAVIGFCFNLAIWVDKFIFWLAPNARMIAPWFMTNDLYEGPIFFSYITIVPALALFMVKIETEFYQHYNNYYARIVGRQSMAGILEAKEQMIVSLKDNLREVLIVQGAVTGVCLFFAPQIIAMMQLIPLQIPLFRIALLASFLQILLTLTIIVLFYFDLRKSVLVITMVFLVSNIILSLLSIHLGLSFYGYGLAYSCLAALSTAFYLLNKGIYDLEFITFASQPTD